MVLKRYFSPDDFIEKYEFIDVEYMNMHNKKVIISDLDNTLISWDSKKRYKRIEWPGCPKNNLKNRFCSILILSKPSLNKRLILSSLV